MFDLSEENFTCNKLFPSLPPDLEITDFTTGQINIKWKQIIDCHKILLPPLHIKLGLIKQFVKALDQESKALKYLQSYFSKLSERIFVGIFVGPDIKKIQQMRGISEDAHED